MLARGGAAGIETGGASGHGFIDVVCCRDPDRHVIELTTKTADDREKLDPDRARRILAE